MSRVTKPNHKYVYIFIIVIILSAILMQKKENPREESNVEPSYQNTLLTQLNAESYIKNSTVDDISQIKIGIIDTGILEHPNLNITMINDISEEEVEFPHGVGVMGIIGSYGTSYNSYEGLLPGVVLYAYNIPLNELTTTNLSTGIDKLVEFGVDIINISLSTSVDDPKLYKSVKAAVSRNVTIICSSGNSGDNSLYYPAAYNLPGVVSVGALNNDMDIMPATTVNEQIDIYAPGEGINSLNKEFSSISDYSGTSMATPIITSFATILKVRCSSITPEEIEQYIRDNSTVYLGRWRGISKSIRLLNGEKLDRICTGG